MKRVIFLVFSLFLFLIPISLAQDFTITCDRDVYVCLQDCEAICVITSNVDYAVKVNITGVFPNYDNLVLDDILIRKNVTYYETIYEWGLTNTTCYDGSNYGSWIYDDVSHVHRCNVTNDEFSCKLYTVNFENDTCEHVVSVGSYQIQEWKWEWEEFDNKWIILTPSNKKKIKGEHSNGGEGIAYGDSVTVKFKFRVPIGSQGKFDVTAEGENGEYGILDPWWNSNWTYRRNITILNTVNQNLYNYAVHVNVTYDSNMSSDFGDLRFTWYNATDGTETELNYWIDRKVDSSWASVWINVTYIPASQSSTVYMYYGNPNATTTSSKSGTLRLQPTVLWTNSTTFIVTNIEKYGDYLFIGGSEQNSTHRWWRIEKHSINSDGSLSLVDYWTYFPENVESNWNSFCGFEIDSQGNIIAYGRERLSDGQSRLIKMDSNFTQIWNVSVNPSSNNDFCAEFHKDIALDSDDNIVITIIEQVAGNSAIRVEKYYPNGTKIWGYYENPSGADDNVATVVVDSEDNIIVAGGDQIPNNAEWFLKKFYPNGTLIWTWNWNPSSYDDWYGTELCVDNNDDYIVAGIAKETSDTDAAWGVAKVFNNGTTSWTYRYNSNNATETWDYVTGGCTVDQDNTVVVLGRDYAPEGDYRIRIVKFNGTTSSTVWVYTNNPTSGSDYPEVKAPYNYEYSYVISTYENGYRKIKQLSERDFVYPEPTYTVGSEETPYYISITLNFTSLDFGTLDVNTTNNPEPNNGINAINISTNCDGRVTFYSPSIPLTYNSYTIANSNFKLNYTLNDVSYPTILTLDQDRVISVSDGDVVKPYYYLDIPEKQYAGTYTTTHVIEGWCA